MFIKIFYFLFHPNELYVNYKLIIVIYILQLIQQRNDYKTGGGYCEKNKG